MTAISGQALSFTATTAPLCVPLDADVGSSVIGGKAHALGIMLRSGLRVPEGIVVTTTAFAEHLRLTGLESQVAALAADLGCGDAESVRVAVERLRPLVMSTPIDPGLRKLVTHAARALLLGGPVVVRSSAVGEDSDTGSFAGQLDSILHVRTEHELLQALLTCWASYWSDRSIAYRVGRNAALDGMGVIIQKQVDARVAGVMFTRAGEGAVLVEYGAGLADRLVAGEVDPGRIAIDPATRSITRLASSTDAAADSLMFDPSAITALADAAEQLERTFGVPQDVEWAMDSRGTLFIVQSRPITAPVPLPKPQSKAAEKVRQIHWSNANVNENFPDPISPLLFSIASAGYTNYFRNLARAFGIAADRIAAMEPEFRQVIGIHGARMYYNLTSIHSILRLAPFGNALGASFDSFVGAEGPAVSVSQRSALRQALESLRVVAKTAWQYRSLEKRIARFEKIVDVFAERTHPDRLKEASLPQLRTALDDFMDIRCNRWLDASLADAAAMVCYGVLQRVLKRGYPNGERGAVHTSLLKAIPNVVSGEPVHALWSLSRTIRGDSDFLELFKNGEPDVVLQAVERDPRFAAFRTAFNEYVERWGFRCSSELMLTAPSFQEEPAPVVDMLRAYALLDGESPVESLDRQAAEREALTGQVTRELESRPLFGRVSAPTCAQALSLVLPWTHAAIRFRERARLKQALLYSRCRRIALTLGERLVDEGVLDDRDDVFWFTMDELRDLAGTARDANPARKLVATRMHEHATSTATTPPDVFVLPEGASWTVANASVARAETTTPAFSGVPACGGRVTGRATVLRDVAESRRLQRGDILVTRQTDPGWAPVFFLISGLVIERGGMLSHGAIIAREFGIPCVVAVRGATQIIPDGATITVDGDHGNVHLAD